ncbi:type II toxin-antitoxin system VapC family toxin [Pseudomonadota bacterium]
MSRMKQRYILDACVLASIVNSDDAEHFSCYSFFKNLHDEDKAVWVVPGLIFFEFQATQSRRYRELRPDHEVYRSAPLFKTNTELYQVGEEFLNKVWDFGLYNKFSHLRGADLLYACIAYVEKLPLVTHDGHFDRYKGEIEIIKPRELYRT